MLYTTNKDVPGIIGALGLTLGTNGVNIANLRWGVLRRAVKPSRFYRWIAACPHPWSSS